jgi:hypothetical protein
MKLLCQYKFKNKKAIKVYFLTEKEAVKNELNNVDNFMLVFETPGKKHKVGLRPDEITQIITLLGYSLFVGVDGYMLKPLKGYNGFKFN